MQFKLLPNVQNRQDALLTASEAILYLIIMAEIIDKERAIRSIVNSAVISYANGFSTRHLADVDNENGVINMKIHNVFIAALGKEIQYYSALARSLDSSLGNMLEGMAISIAKLNYEVSQHVEGTLYKEQTDYIAELLEQNKGVLIAEFLN